MRSRHRRGGFVCALALVVGFAPQAACAQETEEQTEPTLGVAVEVEPGPDEHADRAREGVDRRQLEERLPRSAPDALRFVPGVSVQQTAHGQASPYVRGLTGQRVIHLFDGIRLNTGIYRQGPNQYFFTVDTLSLDRLEVIRGSASTRLGPDALGGAILAMPRTRLPDPTQEGLHFEPRVMGRFRSADLEVGGRAELGADLGERTSFLGGVSYRAVSLLRSGGVVGSPIDGGRALVPRFTEELEGRPPEDWRTQAGTGFTELTFDGRLVHRLAPDLRVVAAVYGYRQGDAPRTDRCPAPEAPASECLRVVEQFRTLGYVSLRGDAGPLRNLQLTLSYQRHHERREHLRPRSNVRFDGTDDVDTFGFVLGATTPRIRLGDETSLAFRYGADAYLDRVGSRASQTLTDLGIQVDFSRGQYLEGARYGTLGSYLTAELVAASWLTLRAGGRLGLVAARSPSDARSGTRAVRQDHGIVVGRIGAEVRASEEVTLIAAVDQGIRPPNLDDLTSRQQTGPGFQFENAELGPERSTSFDLGVRLRVGVLRFDVWGYALLIEDGIERALRGAADCPPDTPQCQASRVHLQLRNAAGLSTVLGVEGGATLLLPENVTLRSTAAFAWGEGPDPNGEQRVPLSRVPPLNGTVEGRWRHAETGLYVGAAMRWALTQDRLAPSDQADARIPSGGTPGWATVDLRGGWRWREQVLIAVSVENLLDLAYRQHGSSINAPGLGIMTSLQVRLWPW